jgi:uncharacterized protein (TIGR03083 family)
MSKTDPWPTIHREREALAVDLEPLTDEQWATPSLCTDWTVRQVVAHMTGTAKITPASFFPKLIGSGFSMKRLQAKDIANLSGGTPAETLAHFKDVVGSSKHPPGPTDTWLGETIIHAEDVRQPLGIKHEYPAGVAVQVADFYKSSNLVIGAKRRIAGLKLTATDTDWSHGDGPEVRGPIVALVMAMTGRKPALEDLTGDGVATLRSRP